MHRGGPIFLGACLLLLISGLFLPEKVLALDQKNGDLEISADNPLFTNTSWQPGTTVTKTIRVKNAGGLTKTLSFSATSSDSSTSFGNFNFQFSGLETKTIQDLLSAEEITVGALSAGQTSTYSATVTMKSTAPANPSGTTLNLDLIFSLGEPAVQTTTTNTIGSSGESSSVTSNSSCSDTKPATTPILLSAIPKKNVVILTWVERAGPLTYYLVAYGISPGVSLFGNPNVGGRGTTSYTVAGLSAGRTYYFRVRAGNGCTPGDFSNELAATISGLATSEEEKPAEGFAPDVLGESSSEEKQNQETNNTNSQPLPSFFVILLLIFTPPILGLLLLKISRGDKIRGDKIKK